VSILYKVLHQSVQYLSFPTRKAIRRHFWLLSLSGYRAIVINMKCLSTFYLMTSAILEFALKNAPHAVTSKASIIKFTEQSSLFLDYLKERHLYKLNHHRYWICHCQESLRYKLFDSECILHDVNFYSTIFREFIYIKILTL